MGGLHTAALEYLLAGEWLPRIARQTCLPKHLGVANKKPKSQRLRAGCSPPITIGPWLPYLTAMLTCVLTRVSSSALQSFRPLAGCI